MFLIRVWKEADKAEKIKAVSSILLFGFFVSAFTLIMDATWAIMTMVEEVTLSLRQLTDIVLISIATAMYLITAVSLYVIYRWEISLIHKVIDKWV